MIIPKFLIFKMSENGGGNFRCNVCPFECGVDRDVRFGACGLPNKILISHVQRHFYEEPFISVGMADGCVNDARDVKSGVSSSGSSSGDRGSDTGGSGTIFFTGCNAKCVFCQNYKISQKEEWLHRPKKEVSNEELFQICQELVAEGAHNINFVTPTPCSHLLKNFLVEYKDRLGVPVIWNSNGYEKVSTIRELDGLVDVYLPDLKYFGNLNENDLALRFSGIPRYFEFASSAIAEMLRQVGWPDIGDDGFIKRGLVIRHLVLPGYLENSKKVLKWIRDKFGSDAYVALMSQYYPTYKACSMTDLNRKLNKDEHAEIIEYFEELGFNDGLIQDLESADEIYTPDFE